MENRLQATFMPRQSAVTGDAYVRPKGPTNFLMIIGVLLFLIVAGAWGGLFFYKSYLTKANEDKKASVETAIKNFEPELTNQLTVLKARMDAGKNLLNSHSALTLLFTLLELNTAQTVRFSQLDYQVSDDRKINLTLTGEARSYNAIAYQSDIFARLDHLKNPVFSGLSLNDQGTIGFKVTTEIDPSSLAYKKLVAGFVPPTQSTSTPAVTIGSTTAPAIGTTTAPTATSTRP